MTLDYFYGQTGELFSFYRIPKALFQETRFQDLSTDAKTLYGILLDRMSLSAKNGWLDEQNRVFIIFTIEDVKRALCCAEVTLPICFLSFPLALAYPQIPAYFYNTSIDYILGRTDKK